MFDSFNRKIDYLRISVTDRCNLRCRYCMPEDGVRMMQHVDILSFEEICQVVDVAIELGIEKVRITGGEPLVRKNILKLVEMLSQKPGIRDLSMTTNGQLLGKFAEQLKMAGLQRINVSLDTLDSARYNLITRGGELQPVLEGIQAAQNAGLSPIKINCVINSVPEEPDALQVAEFGNRNGIQVRYIRQMDLGNGKFFLVDGGSGGDCIHCNRLRLTANGIMKPCLFNDLGFSVRQLGAEKAIRFAISQKPACGTYNRNGNFYNIGG